MTLKKRLMDQENCAVVTADCQSLDAQGIGELLGALLYTFPMTQLRVYLPRWMDALEPEHPVKAALYSKLLELAGTIQSLGQAVGAPAAGPGPGLFPPVSGPGHGLGGLRTGVSGEPVL